MHHSGRDAPALGGARRGRDGQGEVPSDPASHGELLAAVSNLVVGVYADCLGRGPTKARSFKEQDVVVCLLEDTLTKAEQRLRQAGRDERLLDLRTTLQESMHEALIAGMEGLIGREVVALISGRQLDPDIASEVFVLGKPSPSSARTTTV